MASKIQGEKELIKYYQKKNVSKEYMLRREASLFRYLKNRLEIQSINYLMKLIKPSKILDVGIGPGRMAKEIKYYKKGFGIDTSKEMLKISKKNLKNWEFKKASAFNLPFRDEFFDAIISTRFIWHFNKDDRKRIFLQIRNKLKKEGHLIFDFPNKEVKRFPLNKTEIGTKRVYTISWNKESIQKELKENSFELLNIKGVMNDSKKLYKISNEANSKLALIKMRFLNYFRKKEPYTYIALAKKRN
jgi:ubiquinone/menaquinone biosynthesis C-methylase UbiE